MNSRLLGFSFALFPAMLLLGGCSVGRNQSPTVDVLGSYFPAWMVCMILGIVITVIVRLLLIGLAVHRHLRWKPLLYACMAVFFTATVWLIFFKN